MSPANAATQLSRSLHPTAGLEKTLRLLQSLAQVVAACSLTTTAAAPWLQARNQLALGRRYLRFLKFVDAFNLAFDAFSFWNGMVAALEFGRWSCLGIYLLLESCTILDAMGVVPATWAAGLFIEAMKFWFYSLALGIVSGILELCGLLGQDAVPGKRLEGKSRKSRGGEAKVTQRRQTGADANRKKIMERLVIDGCDLFVPGSATGWIPASSANVGMMSVVSTVLAGLNIWKRVNV
ncbi:PEX11 domain protein [Diplocarpon rosae]|nr:PEX11 domain protein [Diplocarpon rosae]